MQEFKAGDNVKYVDNNESGVVQDMEPPFGFSNHVWVKWTNGEDEGSILHSDPCKLELIGGCKEKIQDSIAEALDILTKAGYTVTLSKT